EKTMTDKQIDKIMQKLIMFLLVEHYQLLHNVLREGTWRKSKVKKSSFPLLRLMFGRFCLGISSANAC
ncbi:MAG: hypothetical protein II060_14555, partial [Bacteroidales bacterium]|nr:hypothetical protein [Bacteroidales bacterium]